MPRCASYVMADGMRVAVDTNVLWHGLVPASDHPAAGTCRELLRAIDDGHLAAFASTLTLVELPKVARPPLPIERIVAITETLRASRIRWVQLDEVIAFQARDLALQNVISTAYDAVKLATAIAVGARYLFTTDSDDFPIGATVEGVKVSVPLLPGHVAQGEFELG
jgi:predicted nucleic acid-binding protein